ncbi:MAG: lytic murein transglycosylase [bacterium]|nr:lytic murein transglycosylase [bacterium]
MLFNRKNPIIGLIFMFLTAMTVFLFISNSNNVNAAVQDEIAERERQIQDIQKLIDEYQSQLEENSQQKRTLETEISKLNTQINKIQLEIKSLNVSIERTGFEIEDTKQKIEDSKSKIDIHKSALAGYIKEINAADQETLTQVLLKNKSISDFFDNLNDIETTQDKLRLVIEDIKLLKSDLEQKETNLVDKKDELEQLRYLQQIEKNSVASVKSERDSILNATKGQEKQFQDLIAKSQRDINAIRSQISFLLQQGITAEDAVKYAELAALRAGIRPAFLLAILEIESGLGRNVGSGNWRDDMYECYIRLGTIYYPARKAYYLKRAETEKSAFFKITNKLGLDPDSVKVSKEPSYGCGGAMGPAQFIPSTWLAYEERVVALTGHNPPNPWSIEDAFMASAIKLAAGGADSKTRAGEIGAAKAYIGGSRTCSSSICNSYSSAVLRKAEEIERNL